MARMLRSESRFQIASPTYGYERKRDDRAWEKRHWRRETEMVDPNRNEGAEVTDNTGNAPAGDGQSALSFDDVKNAAENFAEKLLDKAIEKVREAVKDDPQAQAVVDKVISVLEGLKA